MVDARDDQPDSDDTEFDRTSELKKSERWLSGVFGGVVTLAAIGAVYTSGNQAGAAALVIIGGILLLIAAVGTPITRAKIGDKEIEFSRKQGRAIAKAVESEPKEVAAQAVEILEKSDPVAAVEVIKAQANIQMSARSYGYQVRSALMEIIPEGDIVRESRGYDENIDFLASVKSARIGIGVKFRKPGVRLLDSVAVNEAIGIFHSTPSINKMLLIANVPPTEQAARIIISSSPSVHFALWRSPEDNIALVRALSVLTADSGNEQASQQDHSDDPS